MKRYFLHDGREQTGPFEFEELKKQVLTPELMVWHDGIPNWVNITLLEELKPLLKASIPPPFKGVAASAPQPQPRPQTSPPAAFNFKNLPLRRILVGLAITLLLVFIVRFIVSPKKEVVGSKTNKIRIGKKRPEQANKSIIVENDNESDYKFEKSTNKPTGNTATKNSAIKEEEETDPVIEQIKAEEERKEVEENERKDPLRFIEGEGNAKQNLWGSKIIINGTIKDKSTLTNYKDLVIEISYLTEKKTFLSSEKKVIKAQVNAGEEIDFRLKVDPPEGAKSCVWKVVGASVAKSK